MTQWIRGGGLVLVGALLLAADQAFSQEKPAAKTGQPDPMLEAWMKVSLPGSEHQRLASLAGSWTGTVKMWMDPAKPPTESTCTAERHWILGGRFLQEEVKGQFQGQPFQGMGLMGYDNLQKKYTWVWVDSMSTAITTSLGTADASGKVLTFTRAETDPITGKKFKAKDVVHLTGPDQQLLEMFKKEPGGKEIKVMEISLTRKAKPAPR